MAEKVEEMRELWGDWASKAKIDLKKAVYFKESRYALFIHWGLYAVAGSCWKGKKNYAISEWIMRLLEIPAGDYAELAKEFCPDKFDAREIVAFAKKCGMKYIVITAKHHEGFAMFESSHPFNIVHATPWKRDPMKELADECAKEGIGLGFYYSQYQDWAEINAWEKERKQPSFDEYFNTKCLPQIRELLTNYGKLALIWFDTPGNMTEEQSQKIVDLVKTLQPDALVNSRIGNGVGDYSTLGDNEFPGSRPGGLWECIATTNDSWGFSSHDTNFRTAEEIVSQLVQVAARGGNYMVNIGPTPEGEIPEICKLALLHAGNWVTKYGEKFLYGSEASPWPTARLWGDCTRKGNKAYFMVKPAVWGKLLVDSGFPVKIRQIKWLGTGEELSFEQNGDFLKIPLPEKRVEEFYEVLEVTCEEKIPDVTMDELVVAPGGPSTLAAFSAKFQGVELEKAFWGERFGEWMYQIHLAHWQPGGKAAWDVNVVQAGYYQILVRYQNTDPRNRTWFFENGCDKVETWARIVQDLDDGAPQRVKRYKTFPAGVMKFPAGRSTLTFYPGDPSEGMDTQIAEVVLVPFELF